MLRSRVKQLEQELKWQESRLDSTKDHVRELVTYIRLLAEELGYEFYNQPEKTKIRRKSGPEPGND